MKGEEGFVVTILPFDTPTTDGRMVRAQPVDHPKKPIPVLGPNREVVGRVTHLWVKGGWLCGFGWMSYSLAGDAGPRAVEADLEGGEVTTEVPDPAKPDEHMLVVQPGWKLRSITLGDRPAWPDARITPNN